MREMIWRDRPLFVFPVNEPYLSGLEQRVYVQGGLSSYCVSEEGRDRWIQVMLESTMRSNPALGARLVASFIRGWVESHGDDSEVILSWFRLIGGKRIEVTRS